jgi:hypothetical protein
LSFDKALTVWVWFFDEEEIDVWIVEAQNKGGGKMKKLIITVLLLALTSGVALASGDKNHGTKGKGTTSTGSTAQGAASQTRGGR